MRHSSHAPQSDFDHVPISSVEMALSGGALAFLALPRVLNTRVFGTFQGSIAGHLHRSHLADPTVQQ